MSNHKILEHPPLPGTTEWFHTISASKIPAILGVSRFTSQYAMWHEMAGNVEPQPMDDDRMSWGHSAELALADWWVRTQPAHWQLNKGEVTYTNTSLPFPNLATIDRRARRGRKFHILECKTARDLDDWGKPGEPDSVPADYYTQVIWQMGTSGIHDASIIVLGPFHTAEEHVIEWDENIFNGLVEVAVDWWQSLQDGTPPPLDDSVATYETVRGLHKDIEPGLVALIDRDMAKQCLASLNMEKQAEKDARFARSLLRDAMGRAQYAVVDGVKIASRYTQKGAVVMKPRLKVELP